MQIRQTGSEGLVEIIPNVFPDDRGWFYEFHRTEFLKKNGLPHVFPQENMSFSKANVIRGLHLQRAPYAQGKLVTVIKGKVLDVVVDLRPNSATYCKVFTCVLDAAIRNMLMVPEGFAHGFSALEESIFYYKCTNVYSKPHEAGIVWNDPDLQIDWLVKSPVVSEKDQQLPMLKDLLQTPVFF